MIDPFKIKVQRKTIMAEQPSAEKLNETIAILNGKKSLLYVLSRIIFSATVWCMVVVIGAGLKWVNIPVSIVLAVAGCAALLALWFEQQRRTGTYLFEELSSDLSWRTKQYELSLTITDENVSKPTLSGKEIRETLREFEKSTEMILIPGKFASSIYVGIQFLLCFLYVWMIKK